MSGQTCEPTYERLYKKDIEARKFEGRTQDEMEFEKNKEALTFKPKIIKNWKWPSPLHSTRNNAKKTIIKSDKNNYD